MKIVRIPGKREPLVPVPVWKWSRKSCSWYVAKTKRLSGTWVRPILPPHKERSGNPIMKPLDYRRAEIVLALYVRSEGLSYEEFMEPRGGFGFMGYPGPPVHYQAGEVLRLFCCLEKKKIHRYICESLELRNPVRYYLCLRHWHHLLRQSWRRGQSLQCPDFTDAYGPARDQYAGADTRGDYLEREREWDGRCGVRGAVTTNKSAFLLRCGIPGKPWGHRGPHRNGKEGKGETFRTPRPSVCLGSYSNRDRERHNCLRKYLHPGRCGPVRGTGTVRAISGQALSHGRGQRR